MYNPIRAYNLLNEAYNKVLKNINSNQTQIKDNILVRDGYLIESNVIEKKIINRLINRYQLSETNFVKSNTNCSFPIIDFQFINYITSNNLLQEKLKLFYERILRRKAFLQTPPFIILTNPKIQKGTDYNIPCNWHTDYFQEFTFHLPLTKIDNKSTKTLYASKSHKNIFISSQKLYDINKFKYDIKPMNANPGDAIYLDVSGLHRAELGQYRSMVQFKFTSGTNLLKDIVPKDRYINLGMIFRANFKGNIDKLINNFEEDISGLKSIEGKSNWHVIKDSVDHYKNYLVGLKQKL